MSDEIERIAEAIWRRAERDQRIAPTEWGMIAVLVAEVAELKHQLGTSLGNSDTQESTKRPEGRMDTEANDRT